MSTNPGSGDGLTRRERQIMEIVYAEGEASAKTVMERMPDPPTYATVRTLLRVLLEKGTLSHRVEGKSYIYAPIRPRTQEGRSALQRVVQSFFSGSIEQTMACLLDDSARKNLTAEELERLEGLVRGARDHGDETKGETK